VQVAGIVLTRQRPVTAKGMIFLTIEDETGAANIVIQPDVWGRTDHAARRAAVLVVHGRIQRRGPVVHVVATHLEAAARRDDDAEQPSVASPALSALPRMSRDFC
jgi:error-prone DNA polymerase